MKEKLLEVKNLYIKDLTRIRFRNILYGDCIIIKAVEKKYLVYVENCFNNFIVCDYIGRDGSMMGQNFFETLKEAIQFFDKK
ncbi:MAG: hypothetical protein NC483_01130 [Ruminococcus sp.]|nr:hypothetical protein [Ruminococcus sp.]